MHVRARFILTDHSFKANKDNLKEVQKKHDAFVRHAVPKDKGHFSGHFGASVGRFANENFPIFSLKFLTYGKVNLNSNIHFAFRVKGKIKSFFNC